VEPAVERGKKTVIFKFVYQKLGGHVHFNLWAGKAEGALGKCGTFVVAEEELVPLLNLLRRGSGAGGTVILEEKSEKR
jgi:hypothetical protein